MCLSVYTDGGYEELVSGTSMSTPIFAAIVALLNADYQGRTGKPLGFLNPLLYSGPANIFTDITVGDNCETSGCVGQQNGFSCTKGWDPVTGLGSPVYPALKAYISTVADEVVSRQQAASTIKVSKKSNRHSRSTIKQ